MADRIRQPARRGRMRRLAVPALAMLLVPPAFGPPSLASPVAAQEAPPGAPDLSQVTTKAAARKLVREGRLVAITLFPTELGGPDDPANRSFTTPEAAEARAEVVGTLGRFLEEGLIDQLDVVPDYKGDSIVPSRITLTATHSEKPGEITLTIEVW